MKSLSIIIPMYNVEAYVERCLRSLEDLDLPRKEFEIICINDGSPDGCQEVVNRLQGEYENIILINQENQGVSKARNRGIESAVGRYLIFIDPDDFVKSDSVTGILDRLSKLQAQVAVLDYSFLNVDGSIRARYLYKTFMNEVYRGIDAYFLARGDGRTDPDRMVGIIFERVFLNNNKLRYLPDVPYLEDGEFIARIFCLAERCIFACSFEYQRTIRPGSATNSCLFYSDKATLGFLNAANNIKQFQRLQDLNYAQKVFLNQPIVKFVLLSINSSTKQKSLKKMVHTLKSLKEMRLIKLDLEGCNREYSICGFVFNISPWLGVFATILYPVVDKFYISTIKSVTAIIRK